MKNSLKILPKWKYSVKKWCFSQNVSDNKSYLTVRFGSDRWLKTETNIESFLIIFLKWIISPSLFFQSVISSELLDNLKVYEFSLSSNDMTRISSLNRNVRKIVPVVKLVNGDVVARDLKSRHYPFGFEEKIIDQ